MIERSAEDILNQEKVSLIEIYLELQQHFEARFGPQAVVVMEVGSFFEVYGVDNDDMRIGKPKEIAEVLNLQLTRKNKSIAENTVKNPLLAGFPGATFDRYMHRLVQENRYTIIVVRQKGTPPNVTRYIDRILSPGVNFDYRPDHSEQVLTSIVVEEFGDVFHAGYAAADVATGKTYVFDVHSTKEDPTAALDALFQLLQSRSTTEVITTCTDTLCPRVLEYLELADRTSVVCRNARMETSVQNHLLGAAFHIESYLSALEVLNLEKSPLAGEALGHLVQWIVEHERPLAEKLLQPEHLKSEKTVHLGNDPLHQLGILSHDPGEHTVLKLIDYTRTSIGRRLLRDRLLNPIQDATELTARYTLAEALQSYTGTIDEHLRQVYDLERLARRLRLGRLHPFEINFLYDSLEGAFAITSSLGENANTLPTQLTAHTDAIKTCLDRLRTAFDLNETGRVANATIDRSFFQPGFDSELDTLIAEMHAFEAQLELIRAKLLELISEKTGKDETEFIAIKQLDKEGHYISLTKSRYALIEESIADAFISIAGTVYAFSDFRFRVQTGNVKITAAVIDTISQHITARQRNIIGRVRELFAQELSMLDATFGDMIVAVSNALAAIDVAASTVKAAHALRLVRPELIDTTSHENYLEIAALRHPLVEQREENGIYVPNHVLFGARAYIDTNTAEMFDTETGEDIRGMLLYGINASGKSSYMKAIGIAVILAQSGFFVPAARMRFSPFAELFTRIVAKDNVERGLSSFAVEMMELRNIFARASARSLILGDEMCRGTETLSAIAIVSAAMKRLSEIGGVFLFTTHLHQLANLDIFASLPHVLCAHLGVRYDEAHDMLVFDRTLQPGSGSSVYGLEFAQSLHMDDAFLRDAMQIRKHLADDFDQLELLTKHVRSGYHKEVLLSTCSICKNKAKETHHIAPQELADAHGNIGHFHKNHKANLLPICDTCHDEIHHGRLKVKGYQMTSKGLRLDVERIPV